MNEKLYIELRIIVEPNTNLDNLREIADALQESLYNDLEMDSDAPKVEDITYEIIRVVSKGGQDD